MKVSYRKMGCRSPGFGKFGLDFWKSECWKGTYYLRWWFFNAGGMIKIAP